MSSKRRDILFTGIVAHVSKRGTELRFIGSERRYQSFHRASRSVGTFSGIRVGDIVTLAWGLNFPDSLRTGRIMLHIAVTQE